MRLSDIANMRLAPGTKGLPLDGSMERFAYLTVAARADLAVGDLVGFEISHPCTTFDKWSLLLEVDDDYTVVGGLKTFF